MRTASMMAPSETAQHATKVTAAGGIHVYNSQALGLVVCAHEHNRVMGELERENAKLRASLHKLSELKFGVHGACEPGLTLYGPTVRDIAEAALK